MSKKRERLEVIHDILIVISKSGTIKPTRLLALSNLSPQMFKDYMNELIEKDFIENTSPDEERKIYSLTKKGFVFLGEYEKIKEFIKNFGL